MYDNLRIHDEQNKLFINTYRNGFKLIKANEKCRSKISSKFLIQNVLDLPFNVYFTSEDCILHSVNQPLADLLNTNIDTVVGKNIFDLAGEESGSAALKNNIEVMTSNKKIIFEEDILLNDGSNQQQCLTIKFPWYDDYNKIIGIFGCSVVYGMHDLTKSLNILTQLGFLNPDIFTSQNNVIGSYICDVFLTKREIACMRLYIYGKSISNIAMELQISPKTIELYIHNILIKLNVFSRDSLMDKIINYISLQNNELSTNFNSMRNNILFDSLSSREQQCLQHFLHGKTSKQTAILLGLSYRTIEEYFVNIKRKLNCKFKRDLLALFK